MNDKIKEELAEKLESYKELKVFIEKYNKEQLQKGLDLALRIAQDLVCKYPYEIGDIHIGWEDNYSKQELVLRLGLPFSNNGSFRYRNEEAIDYVLKRYPDVKKHYSGIQVATCITKRNIDKFISDDLK